MSAGDVGARSREPGAAQAVAPDLALVKHEHEMGAEEHDMPQHGQQQAPPPDLSKVKIEIQIDIEHPPVRDAVQQIEVMEQAWQPQSIAGLELTIVKTEADPQETDPLLHSEPSPMLRNLLIKEYPLMCAKEAPPAAQGASSHSATVGGIMINIEKDAMTDQSGNNKAKKFKCDQCEYITAIKSHFKRHMITHTGEKPFNCDQCEYRAAQIIHLVNHYRTHTGEKPFKCDQCEYRTAVSSYLKLHMKSHTGEKPYKCTQCEYKTAISSHLKRHMKSHTGEKPFQCNQCEYKTAISSHLKRHMKAHTGDKPFKCNQCEYKTAINSHLNRHIRTHKDK